MSKTLLSVLRELTCAERRVEEARYLFHQGDPVVSVFVVLEGGVDLIRHLEDGASVVLQRAGDGAVLAEASVFSDCYHCGAAAKAGSRLLAIPTHAVRQRLGNDPGFAEIWMTHLAHEVQRARFRSEILSMKTVAQRIDAWIAGHGGELPARGRWRGLAAEIAVSPEALYRELARRRR